MDSMGREARIGTFDATCPSAGRKIGGTSVNSASCMQATFMHLVEAVTNEKAGVVQSQLMRDMPLPTQSQCWAHLKMATSVFSRFPRPT